MIFKEDENGQKGIADTIEILRKMWCEIGEKDLKEWIQRTFILVQSEEILLLEMCESKNDNRDTNEQIVVERDCEKNDAEEGLCSMWCNGEVGDTPQRREPNEQLSQELDLLMQKLSFEDAQTEVIMYCLRITCEGETSVFETLPTIEERENIGVHDRDGKTYGFPLGFRPENVRCYEEKATTLVVGTRAGFCNGVISLEPGIASREGGHIYEDVSGTLRANAGDNQMSVAYSINHQGGNVEQIIEDKTGTLTASTNSSGNNKLSVAYCEGLDCYKQQMTGDKTNTLRSKSADTDHIPCVVMDRAAFNQGENAKYNIGIDENGVAFSCIAKGPGAVCYCVDQGGGKSGANVTKNLSPTLTCTHGGEPVICLQGNQVDRADTSVCNGSGFKEGTSYTLNTMDRHAVCYKKPHYIVRRLTPLECERLQGFPDGWTDIGEYIDSKGKKKQSSDSARYKALGNSIALPQWKWIIKRISAQYERDATLCSLFDGIGGFPHIWEQINGKGSCIWASEIEDFPIAVTKARIR